MKSLPSPICIATGKPISRIDDTEMDQFHFNNLVTILNFCESNLWSMYVTQGEYVDYVFTYKCPYHSWALNELYRERWVDTVTVEHVPWVEGQEEPDYQQKADLGQAYKLLYRIGA